MVVDKLKGDKNQEKKSVLVFVETGFKPSYFGLLLYF